MSNAIATADAFMAVFGFKRVDLEATPMICKHDLPVSAKCRQCFLEAMANEAEIATKGHKPKSIKQKRCKQCKTSFTPRSALQVVCGPLCGEQYAKASRLKKERKETRTRLKELETLPVLKKRAQQAINAYVRARDAGKKCISCESLLTLGTGVGGDYDAGHFRSVGSAAHLRYDLRNINGQCKYCNNFLAGNPHGYRLGYIARFGADALAELESDNEPRHYTRQDLIDLTATMRRMTRELKK